MSQFQNDSIFWIEVDKIRPNPFQPRREFDEAALKSLSDSIKQYGVLQALVVTRKEEQTPEGGISTLYELIAGERRLRASKMAGLSQVPVVIKTGEENDLLKLELAIIENLQREDLNPVDRARAFEKLAREFGFKHLEIAQKIGKSREYVSNTLRMLALPQAMIDALAKGKISEGHTRPLLMLDSRPQEQDTLFKEILYKKLSVRETERIARHIAQDRVRKKDYDYDPELAEIAEKFTETLGTRVHIERHEVGGKLLIDYFSNDDLRTILELVHTNKSLGRGAMLEQFMKKTDEAEKNVQVQTAAQTTEQTMEPITDTTDETISETIVDDRPKEEIKQEENSVDEDIYSVKNFSL